MHQTDRTTAETSERIDLRSLMEGCIMTCTKCGENITDEERSWTIQCSDDKCTLHVDCANKMIKDKKRNTEKQDEAKCECEEQQGEYAYFSKSEVKESLTEKRYEQQMRLMAEMKEQLKESADRITSIEQANKGPVDKHMEV